MPMRRRLRGPIAILAAAAALAFGGAPAEAQDYEYALTDPPTAQTPFIVETGFARQGEADIDGGGSVAANRFDAEVVGRVGLLEPLTWTNSIFFGVNHYDFDGGGFAAGDPWETILDIRLISTLRYALNDRWGVYGGGVLLVAPETGADWGDSVTGGGLGGVDFRLHDGVFLSAGVAVISQLEDDVRVTPSVVMKWLPDDDWRVSVGAVPATGGAAAAGEIAYRVADPVEVGFGLLFSQRRFRLDDSGVAPDGVGEDSAMPLRLRVGWSVTERIALHFFGGVALAGEVELENSSGNRLRGEDYDPAAYFGVRFAGRF